MGITSAPEIFASFPMPFAEASLSTVVRYFFAMLQRSSAREGKQRIMSEEVFSAGRSVKTVHDLSASVSFSPNMTREMLISVSKYIFPPDILADASEVYAFAV